MSHIPPSCAGAHNVELTPQDDIRIALQAIAEGDLSHATYHVVAALAAAPDAPEHLAVADTLFDRSDDPLSLVPFTEPSTFKGTVALRAWFHHHLGEHRQAIELVMAILIAEPTMSVFRWIERWWSDPAARDSLDPQYFGTQLHDLLGNITSPSDHDALKQMLPVLAPVVEHALSRKRTDVLAAVHSKLYRLAGERQKALAIALAHDAQSPTHLSAVFVAAAHRDLRELTQAIEWSYTALKRDPSSYYVELDIGDFYLDLRRFKEAAEAYGHVLAHDPDEPWAKASALYARWLAGDSHTVRDELELLAQQPDATRAQALSQEITPYVGYLPQPGEAIVNLAHQLWNSQKQYSPPTIASTAVEAPSAVRSVQRWFGAFGETPAVTAKVQSPDPRVPWGPVDFVLWRYEGDSVTASAVYEPPPSAILQSVTELASTGFYGPEWHHRARSLGRALGVSAVPSLLGAINHPPAQPKARPNSQEPWDWDFSAVTAATFLLGYVDDGWAQSQRRRVLLSLVYGPVDWATTAAIVVLTELALSVEESRAEIQTLFNQWLAHERDPAWTQCGFRPLVRCSLRLPTLDAQTRKKLLALRADFERPND